MGRGESTNDEETETETVDDEVTESEASTAASKKVQLLGIPLYKLSYNRLPRKCLKFSFLTLNTGTFFAGISAMIISVWMLSDSKLMLRLTGQKLFVSILLIIGMFSSCVSSIGIFAFVKRRRKLMNIYIICHALLLTTIFFTSILSSSFFDRITNKIHDDMKSTMIKYRSLDWVTEAWDNTQQYLECCGIRSYKDWDDYRLDIPQSCCAKSIEQCLHMTGSVAFEAGCLKSAYLMLKSHIDTVAVSAIFVSIISGASLFFALGMKRKFRAIRYTDDGST
ncbi:CD151 antigen-like [Diachasma alloeum]|uniref:CD151 antigen-like n=1 Tax=Diachasma alloeum TaxID=454923 RepID=UPI0007382ACC|nr:CD151 antigen-like [Diachasma alloeum]